MSFHGHPLLSLEIIPKIQNRLHKLESENIPSCCICARKFFKESTILVNNRYQISIVTPIFDLMQLLPLVKVNCYMKNIFGKLSSVEILIHTTLLQLLNMKMQRILLLTNINILTYKYITI